jgi:hypothetical protein
MLNSVIFFIAITLVFIYLVLALMVTGVNEIWFTFLSTKAKSLEKFLARLFFDQEWKEIFDKVKVSPFINVLKKKSDRFPEYVPSENFTSALLTAIGKGKADLESVKEAVNKKTDKGQFYDMLAALISQNADMDKIRMEIERIFNASMDRLSSWYKKNAKIMSFFIALAVCAALNIDTIDISVKMWKNKAQAEQFASFAADAGKMFEKDVSGQIMLRNRADTLARVNVVVVPAGGEAPARDSLNVKGAVQQIITTYDVLTDLGIPMGWSNDNIPSCEGGVWWTIVLWLLKVIGIGLTAVATSLGAPFWFDILSRATPLKKSITTSSSSK